ncbi:MAG: hypothetical protein ACM3TU_01640 [Bacillota bacterium]
MSIITRMSEYIRRLGGLAISISLIIFLVTGLGHSVVNASTSAGGSELGVDGPLTVGQSVLMIFGGLMALAWLLAGIGYGAVLAFDGRPRRGLSLVLAGIIVALVVAGYNVSFIAEPTSTGTVDDTLLWPLFLGSIALIVADLFLPPWASRKA